MIHARDRTLHPLVLLTIGTIYKLCIEYIEQINGCTCNAFVCTLMCLKLVFMGWILYTYRSGMCQRTDNIRFSKCVFQRALPKDLSKMYEVSYTNRVAIQLATAD